MLRSNMKFMAALLITSLLSWATVRESSGAAAAVKLLRIDVHGEGRRGVRAVGGDRLHGLAHGRDRRLALA